MNIARNNMRLTDTIAASVAHVVELLPTVPRNQKPPTQSIVGNVEPHLRLNEKTLGSALHVVGWQLHGNI